MNLPMQRFRASVLFIVLLLSGCDHHKPASRVDNGTGGAAVQNDSDLTGLPPQPVKTVYPRATLVALPPTAPPATPKPPPSLTPPPESPGAVVTDTLQPPIEIRPPPPVSDQSAPDASSKASVSSAPLPENVPPAAAPDVAANDTTMPATTGDTSIPAVPSTPAPVMDEAESQKQVVALDTSFGRIVIELDDVAAPRTCGNFRKLVSDGFYNHTVFHRVIPNFIIQGGDPNTKSGDRSTFGSGGPGYTLPAEIKLKNNRGAVAMARLPDAVNPQRESNGSQFYICVEDCPSLDDNYTVFAHVIKGMDVVKQIAAQPRDPRDDPLDRIEMQASMIAKGKALENSP